MKISRRQVLRVGFGGMCVALGRVVFPREVHASVRLMTPPAWLVQAFDIIRGVQPPKIPGRGVRIRSEQGDMCNTIQDAIERMSARGGGRISLAPGLWRVQGPITLRSRIELHVEKGATVVFSGDRAHYLPAVRTRWEGTDLYGYSPCIYANSATDVAVTGGGSLEMERRGDVESWRFDQTDAQRKLRSMGAAGTPLAERVFAPGGFLRPSFIQFFGCERVLVQGVQIRGMPFWGVHLVYSRHAVVRSIEVVSNRVNNDGVDIDSSSHVVVEGCIFKTGDDCVAIKSGRDFDGRSVGIPSENIVIRDCLMSYCGSGGIAIGSEMSGGVRGVYVFRCDMDRVQTVLNIKSNLDRGGFVERVRVWNLTAEECARVIQVTTSYHGYQGGDFPPRLEDIEVEDLRVRRAREGISIRGVSSSPVKRITLKDIDISKARTLGVISHVQQLQSDRVLMNGERVVYKASYDVLEKD